MGQFMTLNQLVMLAHNNSHVYIVTAMQYCQNQRHNPQAFHQVTHLY